MWLKETLKLLSETLEDLVVIGLVLFGLYTGLVGVVIAFVIGKAVVCALKLALRLGVSAVFGLGDDCRVVGTPTKRIQ